MIEIVSIGDKLISGSYQVHSRFSKVVNFQCGDSLVSLVNEEVGAGPINLVTRGVDFNAVRTLQFDGDSLIIDNVEVRYNNSIRFQSELVFPEMPDPINLFSNHMVFREALLTYSPPKSLAVLIEPKRVSEFRGIHEIFLFTQSRSASRYMQLRRGMTGVRMMRGLGIGLTPSGDDFNAGVMAAYRAAEKIFGRDYSGLINDIYTNAIGDNLLSNALLKCARDGCFTECQKALLTALVVGSDEEVVDCTIEICKTGETSGADWGVGVFMTFNQIRDCNE